MNMKNPAGNYMFKVNIRNTMTRCEISSKITIKTPVALFWCVYCSLLTYFTPCSSVSIVNFEQVNAGWGETSFATHFMLIFHFISMRSSSLQQCSHHIETSQLICFFTYALKTSENQRCSDVSRGYTKRKIN